MDDKEKGSAVSLGSTKPSAPGTYTEKHRSENQSSCLVTLSVSFTFLWHLWMHLNMLEQGMGLVWVSSQVKSSWDWKEQIQTINVLVIAIV